MAQRPAVPDYYALLNIKPGATGIQIQRCYRELVRFWRRPGLKAGAAALTMATIDEAYATLKTFDKKKAYDAEYPSIKMAWKKYQQRTVTANQADDAEMSDENSDLEDDHEDEDEVLVGDEKPDDEDDTDDGGPDGEAEDQDYTERESSDEDEIVVAKPRKSVVIYNSEDDVEEESEDETEAEFTDGEEPESDDDRVDENVDLYIDYCTGYATDSDSESESDNETRYAVKLRSGRWIDLHKHNEQDPEHETCETDED